MKKMVYHIEVYDKEERKTRDLNTTDLQNFIDTVNALLGSSNFEVREVAARKENVDFYCNT